LPQLFAVNVHDQSCYADQVVTGAGRSVML